MTTGNSVMPLVKLPPPWMKNKHLNVNVIESHQQRHKYEKKTCNLLLKIKSMSNSFVFFMNMVFILVFTVVSFHILSNKHGSSDLCTLDASLLYMAYFCRIEEAKHALATSNYWHFYTVEHNDTSTHIYPYAQCEIHKETVLWRFVWRTSAFLRWAVRPVSWILK